MLGFRLIFGDRLGRLSGRQRGFSLIELMVVVAVVAILSVVAFPALNGFVNSNRLISNANELTASLQFARSEAIRRNASVSVCGSANGTTCGGAWTNWITVLDSDNSVLRVGTARPPVQVTSNQASITYRPNGFSGSANITICIPTQNPQENQRVVAVSVAGRTSTATATGSGSCPT